MFRCAAKQVENWHLKFLIGRDDTASCLTLLGIEKTATNDIDRRKRNNARFSRLCTRKYSTRSEAREREACTGVWEIYSESTLIALVGCIKYKLHFAKVEE